MAKKRTPVPPSIAAAVLFASDRTCCVCRDSGKPLQLHHVNGDPADHEQGNLAVLCLECHDETQIQGGFARKLDEHQVRLYRDSWIQEVAARRSVAADEEATGSSVSDPVDPNLATSLVDVNQEADNKVNLAMFYDSIGNTELREKAIEQVLEGDVSDDLLVRLRRMQGRTREVPETVIEQAVQDSKGIARVFVGGIYEDLSDHRRGAEAYIEGLAEEISEIEDFPLAYYLKRLADSSIISGLFLNALQKAAQEDDLWWQVRALEELGWTSELHALVIENRDKIDTANLTDEQRWHLRAILAEAEDDDDAFRKARIEYEKIRASIYYT